ncbi:MULTISPECIES: formylmethanofuran dehydrogenase subunit C [unclassified Halanaerobium]|uniref:formylmethanofuran dehydrogenase subunit C n=1 Tax=unclassified Halanaerobium TaxID=2641197 RepID=UPI000DF2E0BE|nr:MULTISPECIES: formylmethanofuran dehydrogenase subunit C [unclassified Halanaerobium]RCW48741.1 formylmethanofuran dehydrogenase subunit C [Halanaerobium sp. MA284_MarDTE_T2]RCW89083.1 formylmethanofuran dehydrogenase subunit C [Halanaerobium sp. DL-01]
MSKLKLILKKDNPSLIQPEGKTAGKLPVEAENISPDITAEKTISEIAELTLLAGRKKYKLKDFFKIEGEPSQNIFIDGELDNFKYIGAGMTTGEIFINGSTGMHTGSEMSGGKIEVNGDTGDWLGAEMQGGYIKVNGNTGNYVGSAFRGDKLGMNRGVIYIKGSAGSFLGSRMRRGEIIVSGSCGDMAGAQMVAGSIYLFGKAGKRTGAAMKRGTIISAHQLEMLPTFNYNISYYPEFLKIAFAHLKNEFKIDIPQNMFSGYYHRYTGDNTEIGKGEILIWKEG